MEEPHGLRERRDLLFVLSVRFSTWGSLRAQDLDVREASDLMIGIAPGVAREEESPEAEPR